MIRSCEKVSLIIFIVAAMSPIVLPYSCLVDFNISSGVSYIVKSFRQRTVTCLNNIIIIIKL